MNRARREGSRYSTGLALLFAASLLALVLGGLATWVGAVPRWRIFEPWRFTLLVVALAMQAAASLVKPRSSFGSTVLLLMALSLALVTFAWGGR